MINNAVEHDTNLGSYDDKDKRLRNLKTEILYLYTI